MRLFIVMTFTFLFMFTMAVQNSYSISLGYRGNTYKIVEKDLIKLINESAKKVDWDKIFKKMKEKIKKKAGVVDYEIPPAGKSYSYLINMTYTLPFDIPMVNKKGEVVGILYPKGFQYNPLEYMPQLSDKWIFFNSERKIEVEYFNKFYADDMTAHPILTNGSAIDFSEKIKRPVYIIEPRIKKAFYIKKTLSVVYQQNNQLRVDVISLQKSDNITQITEPIVPEIQATKNYSQDNASVKSYIDKNIYKLMQGNKKLFGNFGEDK